MVCGELLIITNVIIGGDVLFVILQGGMEDCAAAGYAQPIKREKQHSEKVVVAESNFMIHPWGNGQRPRRSFAVLIDTRLRGRSQQRAAAFRRGWRHGGCH